MLEHGPHGSCQNPGWVGSEFIRDSGARRYLPRLYRRLTAPIGNTFPPTKSPVPGANAIQVGLRGSEFIRDSGARRYLPDYTGRLTAPIGNTFPPTQSPAPCANEPSRSGCVGANLFAIAVRDVTCRVYRAPDGANREQVPSHKGSLPHKGSLSKALGNQSLPAGASSLPQGPLSKAQAAGSHCHREQVPSNKGLRQSARPVRRALP